MAKNQGVEKNEQPFGFLQHWAAQQPEASAIRSADTVMTWAELLDTALRFAALLRAAGVKPGEIVALSLPPVLEAVFVQAVFHEAAVSCTFPAGYEQKDAAELVFDWLVSGEPRPAVPAERTLLADSAWLQRAAAVAPAGLTPVACPELYPSPDSLVRLVFSSGTTGQPKAVPFTLENLTYRTASAKQYWMPLQPFMCLLGISTVSGFQTYYSSMSAGHTYLVAGSAADNLALLSGSGVKSIKGSPVQLSGLLRAARRSEAGAAAGSAQAVQATLPQLRVIQSAGSLLPDFLVGQLERQFGADVVNLYGSSETGTVAVRRGIGADNFVAGTIVDDAEVQIVDEHDQLLTPGETGIIRIRRAHQPVGYYGDAAATLRAFRDGWFYPGDLGSIHGRIHGDNHGGELMLAGRSSEIINAAGVKVDPGRVETTALLFPGIRDAAAYGSIDANGIDVISLAVVADNEVDATALAGFLRERLGESAPSSFVRIAEVPRNATGKIARRSLQGLTSTMLLPN